MSAEGNPEPVVAPKQGKCVVCSMIVVRDQLRSISSARGTEVRELIKQCLGK